MSQVKEGKLLSLVERIAKQPQPLKKKMCPCKVLAFSLATILLAVFLQGACAVLVMLWWRSLNMLFVVIVLEVAAVVVAVVYIAAADSKPHNSDCPYDNQE